MQHQIPKTMLVGSDFGKSMCAYAVRQVQCRHARFRICKLLASEHPAWRLLCSDAGCRAMPLLLLPATISFQQHAPKCYGSKALAIMILCRRTGRRRGRSRTQEPRALRPPSSARCRRPSITRAAAVAATVKAVLRLSAADCSAPERARAAPAWCAASSPTHRWLCSASYGLFGEIGRVTKVTQHMARAACSPSLLQRQPAIVATAR